MITHSKKHKNVSKQPKQGLFQKLVFLSLFLLLSLSFQQCANMQTPTGGPKDSLPPKVLGEYPPNLTKNFSEKRITITFDEFVKITNQSKEFSVSPDLEEQPIFKIRKKNLVIELPDSLEENTTYTINLGKGLVDYNESNPILNYTYVFATGPELDSLTVSGKVSNGFSKTFDYSQDKDVNVILIPTSRDTIFGKKRASIFTTIDSSGNFKFQNLREDSYRIYAIKEQNNDRIYNSPDEWIGFLEDSIYLDKDVSGIHLEYSKGIPNQYRTIDRKIESNAMSLLVFNKSLEAPNIRILEPASIDDVKITRFTPNSDSARIFLPNLDFDSLKMELSDNQQVLDTILIRKPRNLKLDRSIEPLLNITNKVDRVRHITLTSNTPLSTVDKAKLIINEDSVSRRNFQLQQDTINKELYHIRFNWRPNKNYELVIEEGAMKGPFEEINKEKKIAFTLDETDNYGDITFTFTGLQQDQQYILELMDEKRERVIQKRILSANRKESYIKQPGGKYTFRIIWDLNRNGKWDPADVYTKKKQENIWYMDRSFTIRSNWEQNETIDVKFE